VPTPDSCSTVQPTLATARQCDNAPEKLVCTAGSVKGRLP